jgi:hypothetical protein
VGPVHPDTPSPWLAGRGGLVAAAEDDQWRGRRRGGRGACRRRRGLPATKSSADSDRPNSGSAVGDEFCGDSEPVRLAGLS